MTSARVTFALVSASLALAGPLGVWGCGADTLALDTAAPEQAEGALTHELVQRLGPGAGRWLAGRLEAASRPASSARLDAALPRVEDAARLTVSLPERAQDGFELREASSGLGIGVRLRGAARVARQSLASLALESLAVYPEATGPGTALLLLLRASERSVEDFVAFAQAPAAPQVEYRIELTPEVAGLRLVERTLELLDAGGAPRLRVAPPFVVGAAGELTRAELAVLGCAVDRDPAPPWGRAPRAPGASACTLRVSWSETGVTYPALLDPVWSNAAAMSCPRASFASVVLPGGRVLAAGGGSSDPEAPTACAELYDPATDTWSVTGALAAPRAAFTLSARPLADGRAGALALGGRGADAELASSELYDPRTGSWSNGPSLPSARSGHSAVQLDDGSLLVAGGAPSAALVLDEGASSWQPAGTLLAPEPGSSLTPLSDGNVLLVGPNAPRAQRYVARERRWLAGAQPAVARAGHSATRLLDGNVLLVGGDGSASVELYDAATGRFRFTGGTHAPHAEHTATRLADGRVVIVGGALGTAGGTETYEPVSGTWTPGPGTTTERRSHRAELLPDGRVLAFGGVEGGAQLASAERLDPAPPPVVIGEYKLPARLDPEVTTSAVTELWASLTRPATLEDHRRYPVLVFLHGNHATCGTGDRPRADIDCTYTESGRCPDGFVVVPNHRGYDYVGTELAARGFVVVSVNANRGITCGDGEAGDDGFNLARGRLLLKHIEQLAAWDSGEAATPLSVGADLTGKLDFSQLGMMGHSRGGEGVRAAYEQYRDPGSPWPARIGTPVTFRGLFEIGPVDGQTSRVLNADGTAWSVLLPMCDGDVSDLQGVKPFDRMLALLSERREAPKSTFVAWGANHNYFNSEWQESDSPGCESHRALFERGAGITGSAEQRQIGLRSMLAFFLANVGADANPALNELFDPTAPLATSSRIDRGYTPSLRPNRGITLEDFSGPSGSSARGLPTVASNVEVVHGGAPEHDARLRAARIAWGAASPGRPVPERFLELPFSAAAEGLDLTDYTHLELRAGRERGDDLLAATPLLVQLVNADGSLSEPLDGAAFGLRLDGPVGGPFGRHVVLQTARVPLTAFTGAQRSGLRGARFVFPGAQGAALYLASVRASLGSASLSPVQASAGAGSAGSSAPPPGVPALPGEGSPSPIVEGARPPVSTELSVDGNVVVAVRALQNQRVELELQTPIAFRAQDDQLVLELGGVRTAQARHPDGDLARVVFTLPAPLFHAARDGERLRVRYASNDNRQWDFGPLDKSALRP